MNRIKKSCLKLILLIGVCIFIVGVVFVFLPKNEVSKKSKEDEILSDTAEDDSVVTSSDIQNEQDPKKRSLLILESANGTKEEDYEFIGIDDDGYYVYRLKEKTNLLYQVDIVNNTYFVSYGDKN